MMEAVSQYVLSVIAAAFILAILSALLDQKSGAGVLVRLIGGLFLAFTVLQPIANFDFSGISDFMEDFDRAGESAAASGEAMAEDEYRSIIKSRVEAYILDKAASYQAELAVEVTLTDEALPAPSGARLWGNVSPYVKRQIQQVMEEELGIAKEDQLWIGQSSG